VSTTDVIVIGGGPAGSCAATLLARAGRTVRVLERERFPRFHVGESLLPYNASIFDELGVTAQLREAGFPIKRGAQFHLGNGSKGTGFVFASGKFTRHTEAFQVERARFDEILLRHAASSGAQVEEGVDVERVEADAEGVSVRLKDGTTRRGRMVIDASGRGNLTGSQEGLRVMNPKLKKLAVFGHYDGVHVDPGTKGGDTVIIRQEHHWFWMIPLRLDADGTGKVSVGAIVERDDFSRAGQTAEAFLDGRIQASPPVRERLAKARRVSPVHVTSDFSYRNSRLWSSRCVRVGDAAGFIDPIFSSGVFLAMYSARAAVGAVEVALKAGTDGSAEFAAYASRVQTAMTIYQEMVDGFYTTPFMELFLEPRTKWNLAAAVNAVLAGELEGGWKLRWRMKLFFLLVRLQARFPLVPRVSFASAA
jgi:flavin-dependent dehydrogenase